MPRWLRSVACTWVQWEPLIFWKAQLARCGPLAKRGSGFHVKKESFPTGSAAAPACPPGLQEHVRALAAVTANTKRHGAPFRHMLFYGEGAHSPAQCSVV